MAWFDAPEASESLCWRTASHGGHACECGRLSRPTECELRGLSKVPKQHGSGVGNEPAGGAAKGFNPVNRVNNNAPGREAPRPYTAGFSVTAPVSTGAVRNPPMPAESEHERQGIMLSFGATRLSEKQFQEQVFRLAKLLGWSAYHTHDSRRSAPGFPDLVLAKAGHPVIFAELKTDTGETSPKQDVWLALLRSTGARVFLWRPANLNDIAAILGE